jgi:pimeloyl-ACP methyl ester carboxylesterase
MVDTVTTPDGRTLEVLIAGPEDGDPFIFHNGTPTAVAPYAPLDAMLEDAHLRMVTYSRPGYGASSPWPEGAEPTVADDVRDTMTIADAAGFDTFVTLGWSGGGPRALGCGALLPDRCRAVVSFAGIAPYGGTGLDYFAGMGLENVRDFLAAMIGRDMLRPFIEEQVAEFGVVTTEDVVASFHGLVDEVDAAALTTGLADWVARTFRHACELGSAGLLEDTLQIVRPWGFDVDGIRVPVAVWQGRHDRMVPFGHGEWLAATIPGARAHLFDDEGHLSLLARMPEMLAELRDLAGLPPAP